MPLDANGVPTPAVMRGVIPYLGLAGRAREAAEFYAAAFGATDLGLMPMSDDPSRVMHLQIEINGGALMMTDHVGEMATAKQALLGGHLQLVVDDAQGWWNRAIAAGCREVARLEMQFWGDHWGLLVDPFGIHWGILEPGAGRNGIT